MRRVRTHPAPAALTADPQGVATHCPYCALQCAMWIRSTEHGVEISGRDFPTNRGQLCRKGWTAGELLDSAERLRVPLVRDSREEALRPATWDDALDRIADAFTGLQRAYGNDAVAIFGGGGLTNETAYLLGKFARVALKTRMIDYNGRFCMSAAATAMRKAFGLDRGLPFPLDDIAGTDLLILAGVNTAETMPVLVRHLDELRASGGRIVVIDPRRTPTAALADVVVQPVPGTDVALAYGLLFGAIRAGLTDGEFIAERTVGFADVRATAMGYWPERVELLTGVSVAQLDELIHELALARTTILLTGRGVEQQVHGSAAVLAYINLMLALGRIGRPYCGYGSVTGQGNGQGGREHGQKADQLPGYRRIDDPEARAHVAQVWGIAPDDLPGPGVDAVTLLTDPDTDVHGMLVVGSNPVVSAPNAQLAEKRLRSLDFLAVVDIVLSETAELADVVLPTTQWAEETGTMTNLEGRVLLRQKALDPPAGVLTDIEILHQLARRLGHASGFPTDPRQVFDELRQASRGGVADYSGIDYERIAAENGVFWPCSEPARIGSPRLFLAGFATPDGRARFVDVAADLDADCPDAAFPFYLTTGRLMDHYQSGAQTRRIASLRRASPEPFAEVHTATARSLGISDGERVRIVTRQGSVILPARLTTTIREDTIFVPFHWGGSGRANTVTTNAVDSTCGMPAFKLTAARVEAVRE